MSRHHYNHSAAPQHRLVGLRLQVSQWRQTQARIHTAEASQSRCEEVLARRAPHDSLLFHSKLSRT